MPSLTGLVIIPPPVTALLAFKEPSRRFVGRAGLFDRIPRFAVAALLAFHVVSGRFPLELVVFGGFDQFLAALFGRRDELVGALLVAVGGRPTVVVGADHRAVLRDHHRPALVAKLHTRATGRDGLVSLTAVEDRPVDGDDRTAGEMKPPVGKFFEQRRRRVLTAVVCRIEVWTPPAVGGRIDDRRRAGNDLRWPIESRVAAGRRALGGCVISWHICLRCQEGS
mgnify:CR=1 FL=1